MSTQQKLPTLSNNARRLLEWLESKTGFIKSNDFNRLPVCLRRAHLVHPALDELVSKGLAEVVQTGYHSKPTAWALKGVQVEERIVERFSQSKGKAVMNKITPIRPEVITQSKGVSLLGISIRTDEQGRYCLNDMHKAAMESGAATTSQRPGEFLKTDSAKGFIAELDSDAKIFASVIRKKGGTDQGTYATELVALRYAGWIAPRFEVEVYRTFQGYHRGTLPPKQQPPEQQPQNTQQHRLRELIDASEAVMDALNLTGSSRLSAMQRFLNQQAPELAPLLPAYAVDEPSDSHTGSAQITFSATHLLAKHGITVSAKAFNLRCGKHGLLQKKYRQGKGKEKWFWNVTEKGQQYGKNLLNPQGNETQPHWYESRFADLLELLGIDE